MKSNQQEIILNQIKDSDETPAMLQIYTDTNYQQVFTLALAVEKSEKKRYYDRDKVLVAIFAGADSAVQSVKASMEVGSQDIRFGLATKELQRFIVRDTLLTIGAEKGKYSKMNIPLTGAPNVIGLVHEDVAYNTKYVLSNGDRPQDVIADLMGTAFNLHILDGWKDTVFNELARLNYIKEVDMYVDQVACPDLKLFSIDMEEYQADEFISDLLKDGKIKFPFEGTGEALAGTEELGNYMIKFSEPMAKKITSIVKPNHNPLTDSTLKVFDSFPRQLFPVQAHASTAVAKMLHTKSKSIILQGAMSTGKSSMMIAAAHGYMSELNSTKPKGYFMSLSCPPSLTKKWPKEIKHILPNADVRVITNTEQFIKFHQEWLAAGRPQPTVPTIFIFSFTTLRNGSAIRQTVQYQETKKYTFIEEDGTEVKKPLREGYICHDCGKPHMVVDSEKFEIVGDREKVIRETHIMTEKEFGNNRHTEKGRYSPNDFCYHCGASLWTNKVIRRYSSFGEYAKKYQKPLIHAVQTGDKVGLAELRANQKPLETSTSYPRRIAAADYFRRKCKNFFDVSVVDEVHDRATRFSEIRNGGMERDGFIKSSITDRWRKGMRPSRCAETFRLILPHATDLLCEAG